MKLFMLFLFFICIFQSQIIYAYEPEEIDISNTKECHVWFEINTKKYLNDYLKNSEEWREIGQPILTARPQNVEEFTQTIIDNGIIPISGFKTYDSFIGRSFYSSKAWEEIAETARNLSKMTNNNPVILENEGTVKHMLKNGVSSIDYNRLRKVVKKQKWPEIWFWYAPTGYKEPVISITTQIARVISESIPNYRLIEPSSSGYQNSKTNKVFIKNLDETLKLDKNPISIIYLDDRRRNFWDLKNTQNAIDISIGETVILYPGFDDIKKGNIVRRSLSAGQCIQSSNH